MGFPKSLRYVVTISTTTLVKPQVTKMYTITSRRGNDAVIGESQDLLSHVNHGYLGT
jgi:hypothetical protein